MAKEEIGKEGKETGSEEKEPQKQGTHAFFFFLSFKIVSSAFSKKGAEKCCDSTGNDFEVVTAKVHSDQSN